MTCQMQSTFKELEARRAEAGNEGLDPQFQDVALGDGSNLGGVPLRIGDLGEGNIEVLSLVPLSPSIHLTIWVLSQARSNADVQKARRRRSHHLKPSPDS